MKKVVQLQESKIIILSSSLMLWFHLYSLTYMIALLLICRSANKDTEIWFSVVMEGLVLNLL